jgi:hypothetical protein
MRNKVHRKISPTSIRHLISVLKCTAKDHVLYTVPFHVLSLPTNGNQTDMSSNTSFSSQKSAAVKSHEDDFVAVAEPDDKKTSLESSEDDGPLMTRHRVREVHQKDDKDITLRSRRSIRDVAHDHQRDSNDHGRDRPVACQLLKTSPKHESKHKKPGSGACSTKPVMKNDMKAKKGVIREIESFWGRGFIKTYIPKCHRPLIKRGNGSKRSIYRQHETDPKNWLPSVLKAILMIAKLTDNKQWLKRAMNDVVRYRIKHTGNRKPQLVTTDFDVIEDMLVKDWSVSYSFEIRYKHLLVNRKDQEEKDENIDRIMQTSTDHDNGDSDQDDDIDDDDENDPGGDGDEKKRGRGWISGRHPQTGNYTKESQYTLPSPTRQQQKPPKMRRDSPQNQGHPKQEITQHQYPVMYGYGAHAAGYGPPMDPWGRPISGYGRPGTYNGYGGYGVNSGGYSGYGTPKFSGGAHEGTHTSPSTHGMPHYPPPHLAIRPAPSTPDLDYSIFGNNTNKRSQFSPSTADRRALNAYDRSPDPDMHSYTHPYASGRFKIKHESPVGERRSLTTDHDDPTNDRGAEDDRVDDDGIDDAAVADAEVAAMELELKLAKLKAARMREKLKKK